MSTGLAIFFGVASLVTYIALSATLVETHGRRRLAMGSWLQLRRPEGRRTSFWLEFIITLLVVVFSQLPFIATSLGAASETGARLVSALELVGALAWTLYLGRVWLKPPAQH